MGTWISEALGQTALIGQHLFLAALLFVVTLVISFVISLAILVRLPPDYFAVGSVHNFPKSRRGMLFWVGVVLRNVLGVVLVILGLVLSLPGLPGQGLLTCIAGILLLDFPGKRRLEQWLVHRVTVLNAMNRLRQRYGKPPLMAKRDDACSMRHI